MNLNSMGKVSEIDDEVEEIGFEDGEIVETTNATKIAKDRRKYIGRASMTDVARRIDMLVRPAMTYYENVVKGIEEKPNAVRLNACRGVLILNLGKVKLEKKKELLRMEKAYKKKKKIEEENERKKILGKVEEDSYDSKVKKLQEVKDAEKVREGIKEGGEGEGVKGGEG